MRARLLLGGLALAAVSACGSSDAAKTTTTSLAAPTTTTTTSPTTTSAPTSTTVATTTTAPSTTTTAVAIPDDAPVVTADDAVLAAPGATVTLDLGTTDPCRLLTGTASFGGCGVVAGAKGQLVWFVTDEDNPDPPAVAIYRVDGARLVETLELPDDVRAEMRPAHVEVADLDGRPGDELVVGFRSTGTGGYLEVEVVGADGTVVAAVNLEHGKAQVGPGGIDTWAAQYGPDDPNCCPGTFLHQRLVFDGQWRAVTIADEPTDQVPAGQFP